MKKQLIIVLFFSVLLTGCGASIFTQKNEKPATTENGSFIFSNKNEVSKICKKENADTFLYGYNTNNIKDEFNIIKYDDYIYKNKKNDFKEDGTYSKKCQYNVTYYDFVTDYNKVEVMELDLNDNEKVKIKDLDKKGMSKSFIKKNQKTVISSLVRFIFEEYKMSKNINKEVQAKEKGKYKLVVKPVFRMYHFNDKRLVNDYDFSGIQGLSYELVKVD